MFSGHIGILLVEDERQLSRAIARALRSHGFDVVAAPTAAMARVLDCRFSLGIFAIDLGDGSGVDLARELLTEGRVGSAIFFSATQDQVELDRAAAVGPVVAKRDGVEALLPFLGVSASRYSPRESGVVPVVELETIPGPDVAPDLISLLGQRRRVS